MKYLIIILLAFAACKPAACPVIEPIETKVIEYRDTATHRTDSVKVIIIRNDSLQKTVDSLKAKLFQATYKVERIKYYIAICHKNPANKMFYFGWTERVVK